MPYRKLLILAASPRMIGTPHQRIPAIETFDGKFYQKVREHICPQLNVCPYPDIAGNLKRNPDFNVLIIHADRGLITGETHVEVGSLTPTLNSDRAEKIKTICYSQWHWIKKRIQYDSVVINATHEHRQAISQCEFSTHPTVYRSQDLETRLNLLENWLRW